MDNDMEFVEGTYRLPGGEWEVFVFVRRDATEPSWKPSRWESGVAGIVVEYPRGRRLNKVAVEEVLSAALGVKEWVEVGGPDSMRLR
jgi:hypothetical protein